MRILFAISLVLLTLNLYAQDYFPLVIGNKWTYNYYNSIGLIVGTYSSIIKEEIKTNNQNGFLEENNMIVNGISNLSNSYIYTDSISTNDVYIYQLNNWSKSLQHHYTDGDKWRFLGDSLRVKYIGEVTVPAGTFDSCYFIGATMSSGGVYAPNIGLIQNVNGSKVTLELTAYNVALNSISGLNTILINEVTIYPNPSSDYITLPKIENVIRLEIYDVEGKLHLTSKDISSKNNLIDISNYSKGIYFGKIQLIDNSNVRFKFIKQ